MSVSQRFSNFISLLLLAFAITTEHPVSKTKLKGTESLLTYTSTIGRLFFVSISNGTISLALARRVEIINATIIIGFIMIDTIVSLLVCEG